jgi:predicted metal-dependent hydrolase
MDSAFPLKYLGQYPASLLSQVRELIASNSLGEWLAERYPGSPVVTNDRTLYEYVMRIKNAHLKTAPPLSKICFDDKIATLHRSLGQHAYVTRVQGQKLKAKNELRVASLLKETPPQFLRMVVVHELAHLRERQHDKAFYQLCCRIEPNYHTYELGLRLYLTHRELAAAASGAESS